MCSFYTSFFLCGWFSGIWGQLFLKRMAHRLSSRWDRSCAEVLWWIRAWLAFAIVQALVLCVCDSHTKWRSFGLEDGPATDLNWSLLWPIILIVVNICVVLFILYVCVSLCLLLCIVCVTAVFCCVWQEINYIIIIIIAYLPITDFMVSRGWEISNYNWWPNRVNVGAL